METVIRTCEETLDILPGRDGKSYDDYVRCGKPAVMRVKHRGRTEGPYSMCEACGSHNVANRNAEVIERFGPEGGKEGLRLVVDNGTKQEALDWPAKARLWKVEDDRTVVGASEYLKAIKGLQKKIGDTFDPHIQRAHEAHKALLKEKQNLVAPLNEAETILKQSLSAYEQKQEAERQARERELQAKALREEEDRRLAVAVAMTAEAQVTGDGALAAQAEAVLDEPFPTIAVSVAKQMPKVSGVVYKDAWKAGSVDVKVLAKAVADGKLPATYLTPNMAAINARIRSSKGTEPIPGVKIVKERVVAASA